MYCYPVHSPYLNLFCLSFKILIIVFPPVKSDILDCVLLSSLLLFPLIQNDFSTSIIFFTMFLKGLGKFIWRKLIIWSLPGIFHNWIYCWQRFHRVGEVYFSANITGTKESFLALYCWCQLCSLGEGTVYPISKDELPCFSHLFVHSNINSISIWTQNPVLLI